MDSAGEFKRCTRCTTIVPADASFCGKCGAVVGTTCPQCQKSVDPKTEFCCYCGQTLAAKNNLAAVGPTAVLPSLPLDPLPARKPDWTKGDASDAPVVIIQPDRGNYSSRWYGGAAILCVIVAACVFWQWGMSQVVKPAAETPPTTPSPRLTPELLRRYRPLNSGNTGYQPNQQPDYRNRPTPPSYNSVNRTQPAPTGPITSTAPVPAPAYRPTTDPAIPPSIVIQHGMPAPPPAPTNSEYAEMRRRVELDRRSQEAAARRSARQPDPRTRPGTPRGRWENGRWIPDAR